MTSRAALVAATDQALAELRAERQNPPSQLVPQLNLAAKTAEELTAQFGDDAELAGRVAVAASQALNAVLEGACLGGLPRRYAGPLILNVLAFAGELLVHGPEGES